MNRFVWIFGILLLVASLVGANWAFNNSPAERRSDTDKNAPPAPPIVMALGYIDGDPGLTHLYPLQSGRVVEVASEGAVVKKGAAILKMDDELARRKVDEAKAERDNARAQFDQANLLPEQQKEKLAQQQAAVDAAQKGAEVADLERVARIKNAEAGVNVSQELRNAATKSVDKAKLLVLVERSKLTELKLYDPKLDIARAAANLAAASAKLGEAEYALAQCTLAAPSDGLVLRVHVNPGEVYGPTAPRPAVEFLPKGSMIVRAEILQEWAPRVKEGQDVTIVDDTYQGPTWKGRIEHLAPWFTQKRNMIVEPFNYNDVRYMECVVKVLDEGKYPLRVGQRVRVRIPSQ
ncbi:MAG TPA: HlyD family efflux transporter periplasmic adaptor subunit [Gemmataceae bacterium]|jgi:HlyD family secretion protein|nr:HlyD family efflux transporter periplasmic adaptor subunit [Gemmataceae bacterium]